MARYILYLHPKPNSKEYFQFKNYWDFKNRPKTDKAFNYPFHSTLVQFFETTEKNIEKLRAFVMENIKEISIDMDSLKFVHGKNFTAFTYWSDDVISFLKKLHHFCGRNNIPINPIFDNFHFTLSYTVGSNDAYKTFINIVKIFDTQKWDNKFCIVLWKTDDSGKWTRLT
jgi:hypothetical protein